LAQVSQIAAIDELSLLAQALFLVKKQLAAKHHGQDQDCSHGMVSSVVSNRNWTPIVNERQPS
jgi:hypothetical protein